jgi:ZIP family zinc transporter
MPVWVTAGLWGLLGASSLILGAAAAYLIELPERITAGIMAFGCGVLISAVAYDLLEDGFQEGGIWPIIAGAIIGTVAYTLADWLISRSGGHDRKRSGGQQKGKGEGGGLAIAVGSLLDGIPESVVLGGSLLGGQSMLSG